MAWPEIIHYFSAAFIRMRMASDADDEICEGQAPA